MSSAVLAIIMSATALWLAIQALRRTFGAQRRWAARGARAPAAVRWAWSATTVCCALTAVMMVAMASYDLARRWVDGASDASVSAKLGVYIGLLAYGLARLDGRVRISWPRFRPRGPRLLPPGPSVVDPEGDISDEQ